jgi:predicted Ser/Thr protein kinase
LEPVAELEKQHTGKEREQLERAMEAAFPYYEGPRHMTYYLGNGKDGRVFRLVDPIDPSREGDDRVAVKVWEPDFKARVAEVELQRLASTFNAVGFHVPKVLAVDKAGRGFAMERIHGKTPYQLLFREKRRLERGLYEAIREAFAELNKFGICHQDAHTENYLLSEEEIVTEGQPFPVVVNAKIHIIDFGRSVKANTPERDLSKIKIDLESKVIDMDF